ncbi:hypothetical protein BH10CYA1_BH10CYA1_62460 [soil metagenome]
MKKRNLLSGFALAALLALGIAGTAHANSFSSCSDFNSSTPSAPTGDVVITDSGGCTLSNPAMGGGLNSLTVQSSGSITASSPISTSSFVSLSGTTVTVDSVTANGGAVYIAARTGDATTADITGKGDSIQVLAPSGKITVNGNISGTNLTQIFSANSTISLQDVTNANGDVRIFANSGTPFTIGSSGTNGVKSVHNNSTSGGGWNIYITNGSGSGGITYNGNNVLQVNGSGGPAGSIILDGKSNGNVTLTGTLSADGSGGQSSGVIEIYSPKVISNGATLSASSSGNVGYINLVTAEISVSSALTLNINGNGPYATYTDLSLFPVDSHSISAPTDPTQPITAGPYANSAKPLAITGAGTLTINANGNNNGLKVYGYPLTVSAPTVVNNKGSFNLIFFGSTDGGSQYNTMTLNDSVQLNEQTTSAGDTQGNIAIVASSISNLSKNVVVNSAGTNGGDGGIINLSVVSGALSFGDTSTDFALNANGGPDGGKGGTINVFGGTSTVTIKSGDAIVASAQGGNGDAGYIDIESSGSISNDSGAASSINANAKGTGNGDPDYPNIKIIGGGTGTLNFGTGSGKLALSASGTDGNGNGGSIEVANLDTITVSNDISVAAGTGGGNGRGGSFNFHDFQNFKITAGSGTAELNADGHGTGRAGSITILSLNTNTIVLDNGILSTSGDLAGTGDGNDIRVTGLGSISVANTVFNANGGGKGGDAGNVLLGVYDVGAQPVDLSTAQVNANATADGTSTASSGLGGTVEVSQTTNFDVNQHINVDGGTKIANTDFDGSITLNGVTCQQWKTSNATWPLGWWECVTIGSQAHPGTPTPLDSTFSTVALFSGLDGVRSRLGGTYPTQIYTFATTADWQTFFVSSSLSSDTLGVTISFGDTVYTSVFEDGIDENIASQVGAHELGHAADLRRNEESGSADYLTYVAEDFLYLDYTAVGSSAGTSTRRSPCIGSNAAFAGLKDESTSALFCVTYSGSVPTGYTALPGSTTVAIESKYMPGGVLLLNSQIAQMSQYILRYVDGKARELYAQTFGYVGYIVSSGATTYLYYTTNGLFAGGYFQCALDWTDEVLADHTTPPGTVPTPYNTLPGFVSCASVPAWYRSQLGH